MNKLRNMMAALLVFSAATSFADETGNKAKSVFEQYKNSIVNISLVLTMEVTFGGNAQPEQEQKVDTKATVFAANGMFVTAYSNIDPTIAQANRMIRGQQLKIKSSYKDVKLVTDDGSEIPLKVTLIDKDQNLAFLSFDKEHADFKEVKLTEAGFSKGKKAAELDQVVNITRLGKNLYRSPMVKLGRISSVIKKPRTRYISTAADSGTPVYSLDGGLIGLAIPKIGKATAMVVIPVEDINEAAEQAKSKS